MTILTRYRDSSGPVPFSVSRVFGIWYLVFGVIELYSYINTAHSVVYPEAPERPKLLWIQSFMKIVRSMKH